MENIRRTAYRGWEHVFTKMFNYIDKGAGIIPLITFPAGKSAGADGVELDNSTIATEHIKRLGKAEGIAFLTGNGVTRPQGILHGSIIGGTTSTTAASGQFVPDDVLDAEAGLIASYAKNAAWVMSRATLNFIRKFKGTDDRYLNLAGLDVLRQTEGGGRGMLLDGYPVYEAVDMTAMASSAKCGIFADFKELYTIVDRSNMIVIRDPFSAKATGVVDFLFERRVGGQVVQPAAGVYLACKA
jgi:HK97 family phage major capsid protein